MSKGLKIVLPSAVSDPEGKLRKLEHYYGIEFVRGGSSDGYYRLIGDDELRDEMRFHNQIKLANVKDGSIQYLYNQINLNLKADGTAASIDGSDGGDVMQVHTKSVYAIIGGTNSAYERFIVSDAPFTYDGDQAVEFDPYGEAPDYMAVVDGKARSIFGAAGGTTAVGYGTNYSENVSYGDATGFPRTSTTRYAYQNFSRAKNSATSSNLPYTIVSNFDIELAFAFLAIECRTKILTNVFGHGVSSNIAPTEATWNEGKVSGVRYRVAGDTGATWNYTTFGATAFNVSGATASAASLNFWQVINNYTPLTKVLEAQKGVSDGGELISVNDSDGNVIGAGTMTGVWKKNFSFNAKFSTASATAASDWDVEVQLAVPMWRGRNRMQGNLTQWYGGYEASCEYDDATSSTTYNVYRAPSIAALTTDSSDASFTYESTYDLIATWTGITAAAGRYVTNMVCTNKGITTAIGDFSKPSGRDKYTDEAAYTYVAVGASGNKFRKASLFGLIAYSATAVFRVAGLGSAPSAAHTSFGSAFRVALS